MLALDIANMARMPLANGCFRKNVRSRRAESEEDDRLTRATSISITRSIKGRQKGRCPRD